MRHFEYPYNDNGFWFRNFLCSVMLQPFSGAWWWSVILSPLAVLVFAVFWEVVLRKWLTIRIRKIKNWFMNKFQKKL